MFGFRTILVSKPRTKIIRTSYLSAFSCKSMHMLMVSSCFCCRLHIHFSFYLIHIVNIGGPVLALIHEFDVDDVDDESFVPFVIEWENLPIVWLKNIITRTFYFYLVLRNHYRRRFFSLSIDLHLYWNASLNFFIYFPNKNQINVLVYFWRNDNNRKSSVEMAEQWKNPWSILFCRH